MILAALIADRALACSYEDYVQDVVPASGSVAPGSWIRVANPGGYSVPHLLTGDADVPLEEQEDGHVWPWWAFAIPEDVAAGEYRLVVEGGEFGLLMVDPDLVVAASPAT